MVAACIATISQITHTPQGWAFPMMVSYPNSIKFQGSERWLKTNDDKGTISTHNMGFEERNSRRKEILQHTCSFLWGGDKRINNMWQMLVMLPNTQLEAAQTQLWRMKFVSSSWVELNTTALGSFPNSVPPATSAPPIIAPHVQNLIYTIVIHSDCDLGCSTINQVRPQWNRFW